MQQTFLVIDSNGFVNALIQASHDYVTEPPLVTQITRVQTGTRTTPTGTFPIYEEQETEVPAAPIAPLDRLRAIGILQALTDECLSQILYYRTHRSPVQAVARYLRNCAVPTAQDLELADHYLCIPTVDSVVIELHRQITQHVGDELWRQWDLVPVPHLVGLIGGKDYRIAEWERHQQMRTATAPNQVTVSIATLANYILQQLLGRFGPHASQLPLQSIIAEALQRYYPQLVFSDLPEIPLEQLRQWGYPHYNQFYFDYVRTVMDAFHSTFLASRIDPDQLYTAQITPGFVLVLTPAGGSKQTEERRYHDLKFSLSNGDWIPERDRRWLEEYERTR